jgi:hypothetical protein
MRFALPFSCQRTVLPRVIEGVGKDTATIRTLRRALATIGSEERLAAALNCSPLELVRWLSGEKPAPGEVFIAALDIVATAGQASYRRTRRG